jgi:hypothetical protein
MRSRLVSSGIEYLSGISQSAGLERPVRLVAFLEGFEVDGVCVELGAVDASEQGFATHGDPATATHAGSIHHDRIQTGDRGDAVRTCELGDGTHHRNRAGGEDPIDIVGGNCRLKRIGYEASLASGTIFCREQNLIAHLSHFVNQDQVVSIARTDDPDDTVARFGKRFGDRKNNGNTDATGHDDTGAEALDLSWQPKRSENVTESCTRIHRIDRCRGSADRLNDKGDRSPARIGATDRERNSFAGIERTNDDELPGTGVTSDSRSIDDHPGDVGANISDLAKDEPRFHGWKFTVHG